MRRKDIKMKDNNIERTKENMTKKRIKGGNVRKKEKIKNEKKTTTQNN